MKIFKTRNTDKTSPKLSRAESLACIPSRLPSIAETEHNGSVRLEYPLQLRPFFLQLAKKFVNQAEKPLTKKIELDAYGRMVWERIDGTRDVAAIIRDFAGKSGLSLHDAEISVTAFLRELGRRGLIIISPPGQTSDRKR